MTERFSNNASSVLTTAIGAADTSLTVQTPTVFPAAGNFRLLIDNEYLLVTAVSGATFTVTRGIEGSFAAVHSAFAAVTHILTAGSITQALVDRSAFQVSLTDFNPSTTDIGPALASALAFLQTNKTENIYIPARTDSTVWPWLTAAQMVWSVNSVPGDVEIWSDGAVLSLAQSVNGFPSFYLIDNTVLQFLTFRNLIFVSGVPGTSDDVARVVDTLAGTVLYVGNKAYGIQGRDGAGIFDLTATSRVIVADSRFLGCCRPTVGTGAVLACNGGSVLIDNTEFLDVGGFAGTSYSAKGTTDAFILLRGSDQTNTIRACRFGQVFASCAIHYQVPTANPPGPLLIQGSMIEANVSPGASSPPAILVDGPPTYQACPSLVLDSCIFTDVGGHRTFSQPHLMLQGRAVGQTVFKNCFLGSSLTRSLPAGYDTNLLPAKGYRPMGGGSGTIVVDNCIGSTPQFRLRPFLDTEAPVIVENYQGVATSYPANGSVSFYDAAEQVTFSLGATLTGSGANYSPVTAQHTLTLTATPTGPLTVTFAGTENSQSTFLTTLNNQLAVANGIQAINSGGQIQLQAGLMYGASSGAIVSASADVLTNLGLSVSTFTIPARVSALGDQAASAHPLTGACSQISLDPNFNNEWSLSFLTGSGDVLQSATFTALTQPFTIFLVGRQRDIGAIRYAFDGGAADQCSISAPTTHNSVTVNAGAAAVVPVTDTRVAFILIWTVNGAASNVRINSDAPGSTISTGVNTLNQITLGNKGGASPTSAGWDIAACKVLSGAATLSQCRSFNAWASRRFNISLVG